MSNLHIMWAQSYQPFTRFRVLDLPRLVRHKPSDTRFHCHDCNSRRTAKNLEIRVEYDYVHVRCKGDVHPGWV